MIRVLSKYNNHKTPTTPFATHKKFYVSIRRNGRFVRFCKDQKLCPQEEFLVQLKRDILEYDVQKKLCFGITPSSATSDKVLSVIALLVIFFMIFFKIYHIISFEDEDFGDSESLLSNCNSAKKDSCDCGCDCIHKEKIVFEEMEKELDKAPETKKKEFEFRKFGEKIIHHSISAFSLSNSVRRFNRKGSRFSREINGLNAKDVHNQFCSKNGDAFSDIDKKIQKKYNYSDFTTDQNAESEVIDQPPNPQNKRSTSAGKLSKNTLFVDTNHGDNNQKLALGYNSRCNQSRFITPNCSVIYEEDHESDSENEYEK